MRMTSLVIAAALALATAIPVANAADLAARRYGLTGPLPNLGPVGNGRRVWLKLNCYSCHGNNGGGGEGPNVQHAEAGDVASAMLHGDAAEGGMRSFAQYANQTDAKNVSAYLKSIGTKNEPVWLDWWNAHP